MLTYTRTEYFHTYTFYEKESRISSGIWTEGIVIRLLWHACTPRPRKYTLGHLYFGWFLVMFVSCIRRLFVSYLALWTSPSVARQFGCWSQRLTQGTGYKHTWPLCQKHVTRLVNYPATLCILSDFCCNTWRCNFHRWNPKCETAHLTGRIIKRLRILLLWAFDQLLIPQLLLTVRLGLGIQQYRHEVKCDVILKYELVYS